MRALQVQAPGAVEVACLPEPRPGPGEVLVRVAAAGVCPTDRKLAARGAGAPRVPGHEVAGHLPDGTPVGVHPDVGCGRCGACRAGFENRCPARVSVGLERDGGFAELVAVPERHVVPLGGVPVEQGALLEPLACCLHAVALLGVEEGEDALVVGGGPMGLLCVWALKAAGARRVVVAERRPQRRVVAARHGADAVVEPGADVAEVLGRAPEVAIASAPGSRALAHALASVAVGGRVHAFAGTPDGAPVDANLVHYRHLTLTGSTGSRLVDYWRAVALASEGRVDLAAMPRTVVPLEDAPKLLLEPPREAFKVLIAVNKEVEAA